MARVWDQFLTPRDHAHIAARPRHATPLGPHPALLSIDNYRNVLGFEPEPLLEAIKTWPSSCGTEGWEAVERSRGLLSFFRQRNYPVIHATQFKEEDTGIPGWNFYRSPGGWDTQKGDRGWNAMRRRAADADKRIAALSPEERERYKDRYQIVEQLAPIPGETVIEKAAPSAFWNTPLATHLAVMEVDTLVVIGESTSGCVRASVVDAASHRLPVIVAEDCVYDRHEAAHAINLFDMHRKYADVLTLDDIYAYLKGLPL